MEGICQLHQPEYSTGFYAIDPRRVERQIRVRLNLGSGRNVRRNNTTHFVLRAHNSVNP